MDTQIDYAAGMPQSIFDDTPVADPTTPSPGMLMAREDQVDGAAGIQIAMLEELPVAAQVL